MPESVHYFYVISSLADDVPHPPCKLGVSNSPRLRLSQLQSGNPQKLQIVGLVSLTDRSMIEKAAKSAMDLIDECRRNGIHVVSRLPLEDV